MQNTDIFITPCQSVTISNTIPHLEKRAHGPYTLMGPPVRQLELDPLVAFTSTTVYISNQFPI